MNLWHVLCYSSVVLLLSFEPTNSLASSEFRERAKKYCRLVSKCKVREEKDYNYRELMKISDFPGIRPAGYLVRIPFYVLAARQKNRPFGLEIVSTKYWSAVGRTTTLIRRRRQDYDLVTEFTFNVLRRDDPLKLLIEVSKEGKIQVSIENVEKPLAVTQDNDVLPIEYFGFASYDNSIAKFFYNCEGENAYGDADIKSMCRYAEASENEYTEFHKITDLTGIRSEGYIINFPFYIQAERDAHVLLTAEPKANREANEYEILIGGWGNQRVIIPRKQGANVLRDATVYDILNPDKLIAFLIQITSGGIIKVFRKEGVESFKLVAEANDPDPLPVEYLSFGSWNTNLVKFYFNCSFTFATPDTVSAKLDHPCLGKDVPKSISLRNFLITKCGYHTVSDYDYKLFVKLSNIKNSSPEGYIVRLVLYIQGARDANVLLSTSEHPNFERDFVYEFVIGGWGNQRVLIRKKKGSNVLSEVFESGVINQEQPTKLVLEIANSGSIRLYTENLKNQPIISAFEENVLPIQYVSFASFESNEVQFFYNCSHITTCLTKQ